MNRKEWEKKIDPYLVVSDEEKEKILEYNKRIEEQKKRDRKELSSPRRVKEVWTAKEEETFRRLEKEERRRRSGGRNRCQKKVAARQERKQNGDIS